MGDHSKYTIFILTLFFASISLGREIFVDNQLADDCIGNYSIANRDCSGSDGDAYNTPQEAADIVNPGDIVYFRAGTYYEHEDLLDATPVMAVLRSGTSGSPITFMNYNNEEVVLSAMRPEDNGHAFAVRLGVAPSSSKDVSGSGVTDIIIDGLIIEGAYSVGLRICGEANQSGTAVYPSRRIIIETA